MESNYTQLENEPPIIEKNKHVNKICCVCSVEKSNYKCPQCRLF